MIRAFHPFRRLIPSAPSWAARRRLPPGIVVPLLSLFALGAGCGQHESGHEAPAGPPVPVTTARLASATEIATVEATGTLRAAREAILASKVMGSVIEIRRHAGDVVQEGEVLVVIDSRDVAGQVAQARGALAQAQAAAALAETNFHRFQELFERGAASQLELDQARFHHETAAGAVDQAKGAVATASSYETYARIPAPFSGRVVDQLCDVGDLAAPGHPLMKIEDSAYLRLFASLDGSRAAAATVGTRVEVLVPDAGSGSFPGTIREVTPAADPATRSILVKIDLDPDPALRAGLFGRALLPLGERQVLRVPRTAIVRRGSFPGVFVANEGRAVFRMVTLDESRPEQPEVLSGLEVGDAVILSPPSTLTVGAPIEARS